MGTLAAGADPLSLPLPPAPPGATSPPGEVFQGAVEVRVVNVDVVVTDAHGQPAPGLRREDFQLFEDGKPVEITNFDAIEESAPAAAPISPAMPAPAVAERAVSEAQRLYLVVFVDNFNLRPFGRNRVLRQVDDFLGRLLRPEDRVMLVTHDLGFKIVRPFAERQRPLAPDLKELARGASRGPMNDATRRTTLQQIQSLGCVDEAQAIARDYAQQAHNEAEVTVAALRRFVDSLSGLEGKKAIVYVSDGFPLRPGEDVLDLLARVCGSDRSSFLDVEDLSPDLRRLTDAANAGRVTFYTLEAAGLRGFTSGTVENATLIETPTSEFMQNANVQDSLSNLATETGGRAVLNGNEMKGDLAAIARDLRTYYSLGFSPEHAEDGKVHDVKVKLLRRGLTVRTRTNFRALPPEERRMASLEAALWHGVQDNPLAVRLLAGPPQEGEKGLLLVPIEVRIPLRHVTLVPNGERQTGRLSILLASRDVEGRTAPAKRIEIPLDLSQAQAEAARTTALRHEVKVLLKQGEYVFAFAVHDEVGGETSFVQQKLTVEKPVPSGKKEKAR
jgi:VWFA-related protein